MRTIRAMPVLLVTDVKASAAFYERFGFQNHGFWGDAPTLFCIVQRGDVTIGLNTAPTDHRRWPAGFWAAYVYVSDVDALHAEFSALAPPEITAPCDQPYGCRDFDIVDPDGHRVAFGQDIYTAEGSPPGLGAERGHG